MSPLRPFIGAVVACAALGLLGACASTGNSGPATATASTAVPAGATAPVASTGVASASGAPMSSPAAGSGLPDPTTPTRSAGSIQPVPPMTTGRSSIPAMSSGSTPNLISSGPKPVAGERMTLVGTVEEGVEASCLILTDEKTKQLYNLTGGDKTIVKVGARVTVVGVVRTGMMSFCQQGRIFQVLEATTA